MTDTKKPAIQSANDQTPQTPEDAVDLRVKLREAEEALADEKRRNAELEQRQKNGAAAAPQGTAAPHEKLNLTGNFEFGKAIKWGILFGGAGLAAYGVKSLFSPLKNLFMAGPRFLQRSKGSAAALGLAGAQLLGLGYGGMAAYDVAKDKTSMGTSNATMAARFGVAGFISNQFIKSSADAKAPYNRQSYFDTLTNNTLNGVAEVAGKASDELAKLDENREDSPAANLRHKFVQICTPQVNDGNGTFFPDAQRAIDNGEMAVHFTKVSQVANAMKDDPNSRLNTILHKDGLSARLVISPYTKANKTIDVTGVPSDETLNCPSGYIRARYDASEWLRERGLRPKDINPK